MYWIGAMAVLYASEALRADKRFGKLTMRIREQKAKKRTILKRSAKWVLLLFVEAALVQLAAKFGLSMFESPAAMVVAVLFAAFLIWQALRESKDYKSVKKELRSTEGDLRRYCASFEARAAASCKAE